MEFFENLQQQMEDSYKNIDEALDEFLHDETNQCNFWSLPSQLSQDSTKFQSNCQLNFYNDNYQNQILQEVSSFINNQIQQKNKYLKEKEFEIQQLKFQVSMQQQSTLLSNDQPNLKPFTYQLLDQNSIKQNEDCYAIAINKDCSIIVAGCQEQIKVFEFKQEILKQVQLLNGHKQDVYTLSFMKRQNHFISGSCDNSIIIWARNENDSWICQQKLTDHSDSIRCLVLNNNEDVIFSGSSDSSIKFWVKQNDWKCSQTITDHSHAVYGLSLNEEQNRVISCGRDKYILVIEQQEKNKQWLVIQKIQVEQFGVRICFIHNNTFTLQPCQKQCLHVYEMNSNNIQYIKTKDIQVEDGPDYLLFPQQYLKQRCILVNKMGSNVNLISKKQNGEFIIKQSIQFQTNKIYGCMSDDGCYLITWDNQQKEYQIRQCNKI